MGEQRYRINGKAVIFSDWNDEFPCLCCFPGNYITENGESVDGELLQSLALFGAVVRLIFDGYYDQVSKDEYIYIPGDVPDWVLAKVRLLTLAAPDTASPCG